ncbi:MAG: hypoxanthine phosphoribosyltransferase [Desulfomonile sp.]|nr:hypoxanthine phosphoribosyltransferase [Desulfomonile sp.]
MVDAKPRVLFNGDEIAARVREIAGEISAKYPDGGVLFIGILKGSFVFLADLVRAVGRPCHIDFVRISSYGSDTASSGKLDILMDVHIPVRDRHVILVDDIVDTGLTVSQYRERILQMGPRSVEIAALIDKTGRREKHVSLDYCGFRIEGGFVVGYGLDWDERYRYLNSVCLLEGE